MCIIDHGRLLADLSLEDMRREYRRITLGFAADPPTNRFTFPGIQKIQTNGRQVTFLASENAGAVVELARHLEPTSVDVSPVSLREVFLETVREEPVCSGTKPGERAV